jgi:HK97 family phage major capsid protein
MSDLAKEAKRLREDRARAAKQLHELVINAQKEERSLTGEEQVKFNKIEADCSDLEKRFSDIEKVIALTGSDPAEEQRESRVISNRQAEAKGLPTAEMQERAFQGWCLASKPELITPAHEEAARACNVDLRSKSWTFWLPQYVGDSPKSVAEFRKMRAEGRIRVPKEYTVRGDGDLVITRATTAQTVTTTGGGHTVQNEGMAAIEEALLAMGTMRQVGKVIRTATGATWPVPTSAENQSGVLLGINTAVDTLNMTFGQQTLGAKKYASAVQIPIELMQDTTLNMANYVGGVLGNRLARISETHFATGAASLGQPEGVITTGSSGGASAGATQSSEANIQWTDIVNLIHYVDPALRPGSRFMFHDTILKNLRGLVDTTGRPLWQPSITAGMADGTPDMIAGYPYSVNNSFPSYSGSTAAAALAKLFCYGRLDKFWIRDVMGITVMRADERLIEYAQVGFYAFARMDGQFISGVAGTTDSDLRLITAVAS